MALGGVLQMLLDECDVKADCNPGATIEYRWLGPDTPLMHAAANGHLQAARLLIERHADVNYRSFDAEGTRHSVLLAAVESGHLEVAQLLSSYSATRNWLHGYSASSPVVRPISSEEREAASAGWQALRDWLCLSREWTPLHHIEALTVARTRQLLRDGGCQCDPLSRVQTPAERACQLLDAAAHGHGADAPCAEAMRCAAMIVKAEGPWSPESHQLRPASQRRRALDVLRVCYALKRPGGLFGHVSSPALDNALLDVWVGHVIPSVLQAERGTPSSAGCARAASEGSGGRSAAVTAHRHDVVELV